MVGRITFGKNISGILIYNKLKIERELADVLCCHKLPVQPKDGKIDMERLRKAFEPHLAHPVSRLRDPVFHASLNPNPKDRLTHDQLIQIAHDYMEQLGYGDQPYVVFLHRDIRREHLHIVSSCIAPGGHTISRDFYKRRSVDATQTIEQRYALIPTVSGGQEQSGPLRQVRYAAGEVKAQIASVVRNVMGRYMFCSRGEFNTLLGLFNVSVEECRGEVAGRAYEGVLYGALDDKGERTGRPIKASRIGRDVGAEALKSEYGKGKQWLKSNKSRLESARQAIRQAMLSSRTPSQFAQAIRPAGLSVIFHRSEQAAGRIYGVTFIDHTNRIVVNGSRLDRAFAANKFQALFNPTADSTQTTEQHSPQEAALQPAHLHPFPELDILSVLIEQAADTDAWEEWQRQQKRKKRQKIIKN